MRHFDQNLLIFLAFFLLIFGILFNWLTAFCQRRGYAEGYTWLFVVIGTAVTLAAAGPLVGWDAVLLLMILFAASGAPMAAGDIWRYWQGREKEQESQ